MSRTVILSFALLFLAAAGLGLVAGLRVAGLDESAVIDRVGRDWVAAGGRTEDCVARPGQGRVWLVVTCGTGSGATVRAFNRLGVEIEQALRDGT